MSFKLYKYIILPLFIISVKGYCTDTTYLNNLDSAEYLNAFDSPNNLPQKEINKSKTKKTKKLFERKPAWFMPDTNFEKPVILIYILTAVIIYSISSIIIMLIFMIINRGKRDKTTQIITELKEQYQTALVDYLEHENNNTEQLIQIREIADSSFTRKILINEMIDLSVNLPKDKAEVLRDLYFELGLNEDSLAKLTNRHWHTRIKGFKECAFMYIKEAQPIIEKRLNSRNEIERSEAQLALVRLNTEDPYSFLDNLKRPFSVWEQNIIHQEITYHNLNIPKFERWCYSDNASVRKFSSKMIQLFDQKRSWGKLVELLKDENDKIRATAINSLGNINVKKSQAPLKEQYQYEDDDNKLFIIQALAKFKDLNNLVFFKHILEEEDNNVWLQIEAAKGIKLLGDKGNNELKELLNIEEYRNYQIVIKQILNERI